MKGVARASGECVATIRNGRTGYTASSRERVRSECEVGNVQVKRGRRIGGGGGGYPATEPRKPTAPPAQAALCREGRQGVTAVAAALRAQARGRA